MTSKKRYAPEFTIGPTTPIEIRAIYDKDHYRCELRECGRLVKTTHGDFLVGKEDLTARVQKLTELIGDAISDITTLVSRNLNDYTINISMQPVLTVDADNVRVGCE